MTMHQEIADPVVARFTFKPDRASDFLDDGRLVTQIDCDGIDEVMEYVIQFDDALDDCTAIVNGQVISLSDHPGQEV